jgi:hypothetical protein
VLSASAAQHYQPNAAVGDVLDLWNANVDGYHFQDILWLFIFKSVVIEYDSYSTMTILLSMPVAVILPLLGEAKYVHN